MRPKGIEGGKGRAVVGDPTRRFSNRVDNYVKYRPSYPPAVVDALVAGCGLTPEWTVADVGSGPGNLARLFLDRGNAVIGVEPNAEMRAAGERLLAGEPRFRSVDGSAEATGLPAASVDLVVAGQAFHWFDPERARTEFARILRPPPWVALVWNGRRAEGTPFLVAYEALLERHGTDYATVRHQDTANDAALAAFFAPRGYEPRRFENRQSFDREGLRGRLLSSSYVPHEGDPGAAAMLEELDAIFAAHQRDGRVSYDYETKLYYGLLAGAE